MNLVQGKLAHGKELPAVMEKLPGWIINTLEKPPLEPGTVIDACQALQDSLPDTVVRRILSELGMGERQAEEYLRDMRSMFSSAYLWERLETELDKGAGSPHCRKPMDISGTVEEKILPLGVLFHIAAGNLDGLPVYSVVEGLLAGNINLLKLPSVDGGLSLMLLEKLCQLSPVLSEYIYVFELSSKEDSSVKQLAALANAVVVWGGDAAVTAIRQLAPPNTQIIEWGHKLSFAYVTKAGITRQGLAGLARNICMTNQLLCSSCQGVFLDTESPEELQGFCETFLSILEEVSKDYPEVPLGAKAQTTLRLYTQSLMQGAPRVFRGETASLTLEADSRLTASMQFRNLWVKGLLQEKLIGMLYPYKNHLQTAALLCGPEEWDSLRDSLWRAGVVRVCSGADMSASYCGAAHDGVYPLRRYTRLAASQK